MKQKGLYFTIGLFFIATLCVLTAGIIYLRSDGFQGKPVYIETYINESVQGLEVGSVVKYRGVSVGTVETITFVPNVYKMNVDSAEYDTYSGHVLVVMKLDRSAFPGLAENETDVDQILNKLVALGLRLKLSYQGITGITFIEADYLDPQREGPLTDVPWEPKHYYIPSTASLITSFTQSLDNIYRRLEAMDFEGLITKMQETLDSIDQAVTDAKVPQVRESVVELVSELRQSNSKMQDALDSINTAVTEANVAQVRESLVTLFEELRQSNKKILSLLENSQELPANIQQAAKQFNKTLLTIESLVQRNEPDAEKLLVDLKVLAQNLRQLSETLKTDPAMFIFSSPPEPSENVK